ncbi:MAG TPA: GNAT family N-acetyltransferase [Acidimicrobiia bacterium]|nr:GNAT family N-acetyltransferase [Acidimicrobiia bacterium]
MTSTRLLEDGDTDEVLELMRLSLGESRLLERTPDLFRWKHVDNPFGRSIGLVAEEGGQIVGLRTFMRWELVTQEGAVLSCARAVDTATHPEHQGKGIFRRLTEEAVEVAREDGIAMIFNTPNEKSRPGYLKMGWSEIGVIGALVRPSLSMLTRVDDEGTDDPEVFMADPAPASASGLVDRAPLGLRTRRTPEYLAWRFSSHPTARYFVTGQSSGRAVLRPNVRRGRRELVLADLFGEADVAARAATSAARRAYVATWFSRRSPERSAVIRRGFLPIPGLAALTLVMRPLRDLPESYRSLEAWDTAVSDFELL